MRRHKALLAAFLGLCLSILGPTSAMATPPTIERTAVSEVTTTAVTLEAEINPQKKATKYRFEYGTADCASNPCTSTPVPDESIGSGEAPVAVKARVEGLSPGTAYHFRVVAKSTGIGGGETTSADHLFSTYLPPITFDPCPNDVLRESGPSASLPDCRAYEQASPVDKNGLDARGTVSTVKAAVDGSAISFAATSGIPGGDGSHELPLYLAKRTGGGWSTQGLYPPGDVGPRAKPLGWTPDFSQVFSFADRAFGGNDLTLLSRSTSDGALTTILPYGVGLEQVSFGDTSPDGSELFFQSQSKLPSVPAAIAGKPNLYLWQRDTGAISLAGVLNDGTAPPQGAFLAGNFKDEQGNVAEGYARDNHGFSGDGSVFFVAKGSGDIYQRRNPTQPQSALDGEGNCTEPDRACTIEISASHKENGGGDDGHDAAGSAPKNFMTATPDGAHVFFTSSEKLTDDATTGPEPEGSPAIAKAELADGSGKDLGFLPAHAFGIAIQGEYAYWANPLKESIGRSKLNGDEFDEEFIEGAGNAQYVTVDGEYLYWSNSGDGEDGHGSIGRAKLGPTGSLEGVDQEYVKGQEESGEEKPIVSNPRGIAVNAEHVYWANGGETVETRTIGRAKLGVSEGEEISASFIQVDHGAQHEIPEGIALDSTHIYWTVNGTQGSAFIVFRDLNGNPLSEKFVFDETNADVRGIAIDGSHVYWSRQGQDTIGRCNLELEGVSCNREFIKDAGHPRGLALDGQHLYWSGRQDVPPNPGNDLYRYDAATGGLTDVAPDPGDPDGADVRGVLGASDDGSYVYFAANAADLDGVGGPVSAGNCTSSNGVEKGSCNVYLAHAGAIDFVARLDPKVWLQGPPLANFDMEKSSRVSADGRILLFGSTDKLTSYDNEGNFELYRYDADTKTTLCVSCNPTGAAPTGSAAFGNTNFGFIVPPLPAPLLSRVLSSDGDRVFFESPDALVGADTNGEGGCPMGGSGENPYPVCQDVYEWEANGSGSCHSEAQNGGCLYLLSSGKSTDGSILGDASVSGDDVFIFTRSQLAGQDKDGLIDVYDVRAGGGLSSQNEVPPVPCEGESCKAGASTPPPEQSPASASFSGPGDPKPHTPRKKKHRKKRHARHHREAKKTGRAHR